MDSIVLTYKSCSLKQSDINCLAEYSQLNDIIISFYYEILSEKFKNEGIVLLDPAVTMSITIEPNLDDINQCIFLPLQMSTKKFIFAPINDNKKIEISGDTTREAGIPPGTRYPKVPKVTGAVSA